MDFFHAELLPTDNFLIFFSFLTHRCNWHKNNTHRIRRPRRVTLPADPPELRHVDESIWRVLLRVGDCVTEAGLPCLGVTLARLKVGGGRRCRRSGMCKGGGTRSCPQWLH